MKIKGEGVYHCMTRTVNGERLFKDRDKEVLRKMLWRIADFSGVEVLTYCILSNHFHVLVRVPEAVAVSDDELVRRFRLLYPKPTKYQTATVAEVERCLRSGGEDADAVRRRLLARMGDVSEFMKSLKQRFSIWYNHTHDRYGTLWAERFKSVLVEGAGNALQTMAAYIDLNPVRAGLVEDPKDYRFCGYAEALAGSDLAQAGLRRIWADWGRDAGECVFEAALRSHRALIFGKGSEPGRGASISRERALKVLEEQDGVLPKAAVLRCRVRYFTDGAILGSSEFVRGFVADWQRDRERKHPPKSNSMRGADWGDLAVIRGLRRKIFG